MCALLSAIIKSVQVLKFSKHLHQNQLKSSHFCCTAVVLSILCPSYPRLHLIPRLLCSQDLAEHLVTHGHCLSSADHKELRSLFNVGQESSRWATDRCVALAMANLDIPRNWNVLGGHGGDGESQVVLYRRMTSLHRYADPKHFMFGLGFFTVKNILE